MSNTDTNAKPPATKPKDSITCDLYNPTNARRIIYDGINVDGMQGQGNVQKAITIDAGATVRNVTISKFVADELRDRNRKKKDSDVVVKPMSSEPTEPESKTAA